MKNFDGEIVIIPTDKSMLSAIGDRIHNQLIGNEDYIESNIGINISKDQVLIWFDNCKNEIPDITL